MVLRGHKSLCNPILMKWLLPLDAVRRQENLSALPIFPSGNYQRYFTCPLLSGVGAKTKCHKKFKDTYASQNLSCWEDVVLALGVTVGPKMDVFLENFRRGGHFRSKKLHCRFCWFQSSIFWRKKAQCNFQKGGRGGGHRQSKKFNCKFTHT